jgi:hypothetical protein
MPTIFEDARKRREREAGLSDAPADKPLPPYGSMTLGGKAKPTDPETEAAKKAALVRLLRSRGAP